MAGRAGRSAVFAVVVVGLTAVVGWPSLAISGPTERVGPSSRGQIAYERHMPPDNYEIFLIQPDGSGRQRLTRDPGHDFAPAVSPDGQQIAFSSEQSEGIPEIFLMSPDGTNVRQVTSSGYPASFSPSFSADGERIVFAQVKRRGEDSDLFSMNVDGTGRERLTNLRGSEGQAVYSPDGGQVAFLRRGPGVFAHEAISVIDSDGSNLVDVDGPSRALRFGPDFAPTGETIVFARDGIRTVEPDGSNKQLLHRCDFCLNPTYSPDGSQIAFTLGGSRDPLRIIDSDGSDRTFVPNAGEDARWPEWGPSS